VGPLGAIEASVTAAAAALRRGGVIVYPTETLYGLGALAGDAGAVARLAEAKGRPDGKPMPILAADLAQLERVAVLGPLARRLGEAFWPGPLTLVVEAAAGLPAPVLGGGRTVGVRITSHPVAAALCRAAGGPLVATSANLAGRPAVASLDLLDPLLRARADALVDAGPTPGGPPSTVVAVEGGRLLLLRAGAIAVEAIEVAAGLPVERPAG